ncbi:MAG: alpha-E domain-containing protein [Rikenellaceae bacterium]
MVCNVITADKANRLFWLGRYAERVYISLHLLRRYYDRVIDGDISNLHEYYKCLGQENEACTCAHCDFQMSQLYDLENECSIAKSLELSIDNGIVLRHDISTESLSYIQMSKALLDECHVRGEKNVAFMQPITDYMLAFFGSIDERVFDERIRKFLKIGKYIENIDLHIRFDYPFFRIEEVFNSLKDYLLREGDVVDAVAMEYLEELITEEQYTLSPSYKTTVLGYLSRLVTV